MKTKVYWVKRSKHKKPVAKNPTKQPFWHLRKMYRSRMVEMAQTPLITKMFDSAGATFKAAEGKAVELRGFEKLRPVTEPITEETELPLVCREGESDENAADKT